MDTTNGFRQPGDIGGPMDINEGYRWNVPVLTYGFDRSFLEYFGSNGVAAVEAAIQTINELPSAGELVLTNFPTNSQRENFLAENLGLIDLKSQALAALLEQLGFAQPARYINSVRRSDVQLKSFVYLGTGGPDWPPGIVPDLIIERNFDPVTLNPTYYVNGSLYGSYIQYLRLGPSGLPLDIDAIEFLVDPLDSSYTAVADRDSSWSYYLSGYFYTGLTYDDVGGLKFLLETNRTAVESLLPSITSADNGPLVNTALRPGINKISLIPQPVDNSSGAFQLLQVSFTDAYYTNAQLFRQNVQRSVPRPDILFAAGDTDGWIQRSGTSNWVNNAAFNADTNLLGPGIIVPPVTISFGKLGPAISSTEPSPEQNAYYVNRQWGFFDSSTNIPISFPQFASTNTGQPPLALHLYLYNRVMLLKHAWQLPVPLGGTATVQTSTNLVDWLGVMTVTNSGSIIDWYHSGVSQSQRFFRVVPNP